MEQNLELRIVFLIVRVLITVYCVGRAGELKRDKVGWGFFAFFLPIIAIIWIQFMKTKKVIQYSIIQNESIDATIQSESINETYFIDNQFIDSYITQYGNRFPSDKINKIRHTLEITNIKKVYALNILLPKNPRAFLIASIFGGIIGIDRLLLDNIVLGLVKMFSLGGFGVILIYDIYTSKQRVQEYNFKQFTLITQSQQNLK